MFFSSPKMMVAHLFFGGFCLIATTHAPGSPLARANAYYSIRRDLFCICWNFIAFGFVGLVALLQFGIVSI
jgi:hypothetical protein